MVTKPSTQRVGIDTRNSEESSVELCVLERRVVDIMAETEQAILGIVRELMEVQDDMVLSADSALIGDAKLLTSVALVELCIRLEDLASESGFEFDWMSESAMSRSRSFFRTIGSLASEYDAQRNRSKQV